MQYEATEFESVIKKHPQEKKELIPILQDIQAKFNYLPQDAISGELKKVHVLDQSKCIKCGACYEACNFDAIKIE